MTQEEMQAHQTLLSPYGTTLRRDRPLLLKITGDFGDYNFHSFQLFFQYYGLGQGAVVWTAMLQWLGETPSNGGQMPREGYLSFDIRDDRAFPAGMYELVRVSGSGRAYETEGQELVLEKSEGNFMSFTLEGGSLIQPATQTVRTHLDSIS